MAVLEETASWTEYQSMDTFARALATSPTMPALEVEYVLPHPLYYLSLSHIVATYSLEAATPIGWRRVVQENGAMWGLLAENGPEESFHFAGKAPLQEAERGLSTLEYLANVVRGSDDFELRALSAPPLMNLGVWLLHALQHTSLIIPVETCVRGLLIGQVHTEREFLDLMIVPAHELLAFAPNPRA
jgi:hypothetical protein